MGTGSSSLDGCDTFPKLLIRNARIFAQRPAMREKEYGIWQTWTWSEVHEEIRAYALGLQKLGLKRGDKLAIVGDNRPRLYWTAAAAQSLGAVPVPVYQDSVAEEMAYVFEHSEASFAVVENQEQVDKILQISETVDSIKQIVYDDERGLKDYTVANLHSYDSVVASGREMLSSDPKAADAWKAEVDQGKGSDVGVMLYTSGTTGRPKGVMLTFDNVLISAANACEFEGLTEFDEALAYLPMAWIGDHIFSFGQSYVSGFCVACPESQGTMHEDLREIGPTYFFAPPRFFENLLTTVMIRMEDAGGLKRKMFHYFLDVAKRVGEPILNGEPVSFGDRLLYGIGRLLVYGPLLNNLGLTRVTTGYTAGEAIGPELFAFYRSLGMNLKQLYGQTEASVFVTIQPDGEIRADTVGPAAKDVELRIDEKGELLYRSPGVFHGYFKNEEATRETKTEDGWVHSGDAAIIDGTGHLKIVDRAKDVGRLNNDSMFPPKYIENKLKFFPNIMEAVAFGHERDYCSAFINIDLDAVGNWAERNNIVYGSYQELAAHPDVYAMIEQHMRDCNKDLASEPDVAACQIKRFLILHKQLDADDGEITRTQKVRRSFVAERYKPLIDALYDPKKSRQHIKTEVTFEDGRVGSIEAEVEIRDVETYPVAEAVLKEAAE